MSSLSRTLNAPASRSKSNSRSASLDTLPQVNQINFGGDPIRSIRSTKSTSLLGKIALASRAREKIVRSVASRSPRSRKATASCPNCGSQPNRHLRRQLGINPQRCHALKLPAGSFRFGLPRIASKRECPLIQDQGNRAIFAPLTPPRRASPKHHSHGCACRVCRPAHRIAAR